MAVVDLHDVYTTGFEVRAAPTYPATTGALTTPSVYSATLSLYPDGASTSASLTVISTGILQLTYATTVEGHYEGYIETTPGGRQPFSFDVVVPRMIVSLMDIRTHLNLSSTTNDEELRAMCMAATDYVEGIVGPVVRQTITRTFTPGSDGQVFFDGPVISVSSITDTYGYGWTYNVANYYLDTSGVLTPLAYTTSRTGYPVTVTYVAGYTVVPALIREAALDYIKWAWESQRGPSGSPFQGGEGEFPDLTTATPPYKIAQKLQRYVVPSIA